MPGPPVRDGVLITRPEPGGSETAALVAALGLRPILAPMLSIRALPARLPAAARLQAILVTSGNALPAIPATHRSLTLLAVGAATAARAAADGFGQVTAAAGDAVALAELAARHCRKQAGPLLLATGRGQGAVLLADLRRRGFRVLRRAVYAAEPIRALPAAVLPALADGRLRVALFYSAATARAFTRLLCDRSEVSELAAVEAIAIAEPTAQALARLPWKRVRVAVRPTQDDMLALLR